MRETAAGDKLQGKVVVITGSTRGLGLAMAHAFAAQGARLVVSSRSADAVDEAVSALRAAGGQAAGHACDVAELGQVRALMDAARKTFGVPDVWINNAGLSAPYGPTVQVPPERFLKVLGTNVLGTYHGSLVALEQMVPRRRGKLINLLGRGDRRPVPKQNAYASSKAWIRSFTLALAAEHRGSGVGVYAFNPGLVDTDLVRQPEAIAGFESEMAPLRTVLRLWANPPAVPAARALWLASAATDGKTGLEVSVLGPAQLLLGVAAEGLRRLLRRPAAEPELHVRTVPAHTPPDEGQASPRT
ncbi:MAG: SDR family oxidoreductase [Polyangia bacterium]